MLVGLEGEDVHRRQYKMKDKDKGKGEGGGEDMGMGEVEEEAGGPTPDKGEGDHVRRYTLKSWWGLCHCNVII